MLVSYKIADYHTHMYIIHYNIYIEENNNPPFGIDCKKQIHNYTFLESAYYWVTFGAGHFW